MEKQFERNCGEMSICRMTMSVAGGRNCFLLTSHSVSSKCLYIQALIYFCVTPFCLNAPPCQDSPLLNLRPRIFGLTPFGCCAVLCKILISVVSYAFLICTPTFFRNASRA